MTDPSDPRGRDDLPPELDPRRSPGLGGGTGSAGRPVRGADPAARSPRRPARDRRPDRELENFIGTAGHGRTGGASALRGSRQSAGGTGHHRVSTTAKVLAATLSVLILIGSGTMWSLYRKFNGQTDRIGAIPAAQSSDIDGTSQNILLVGNDSRGGLTNKQLAEVGTQMDSGFNTDTILLLHIPADGSKATLISFPRDSYVAIPGFGKNKINSAYADGACYPKGCGSILTQAQRAAGAQLLVKTVSNLTGLHIDHYVEVGLLGFYNISKALGGVTVCLKAPAKDHYSGIDLPAGRQKIEGKQALAFVRQRHGLPHGDLDRIKRQQAFLGSVAHQVLGADTLLNPIKLNKLLDAVSRSLTIDKSLDPLKLAGQLRNLAAGNVTFTTVPVKGGETIPGIGDVIVLDTAKLPSFIHNLIGAKPTSSRPAPKTTQAAPAVPRSQTRVQVLNGSGAPGVAGAASTQLAKLGFHVLTAGNADRATYSGATIRFAPSQAGAARALAAVVPGATMTRDATAGSAVQLIVGANFLGFSTGSSQPAPPASTSGSAEAGAAGSNTDNPNQSNAAQQGCVY